MMAEGWMSRHREPLELTPEQEEAIRPIVGVHLERMLEVMPAGGASGRSGMRSMLAARDQIQSREAAFEDALEDHLSKQQMKTYRKLRDAQRKEMRDQLMQRRGGRGFRRR